MEEIGYLVSSGISLEVKSISNPTFPLKESEQKNLIKPVSYTHLDVYKRQNQQ